MISMWWFLATHLAVAATVYDLPIESVPYEAPAQHVGFDTVSGEPAEVPVLTFALDYDRAYHPLPGSASTLTVEEVTFTWLGQPGSVSALRVWRDASGTGLWSDGDTLLATLPMSADGRVTWVANEDMNPDTQRRWHVTALVEGSAVGCAPLAIEISHPDDFVLSELTLLATPQPRASDFPVRSRLVSEADLAQGPLQATVAEQPEDVVGGYEAEVAFEVARCDGSRLEAVEGMPQVQVLQGADLVDEVPLATTADALQRFRAGFTPDPGDEGPHRFRLPAGVLWAPAGYGTLLGGPAADVDSATFEVTENTLPRVLENHSPQDSAPAGTEVLLRVRVLDDEGVPVGGEPVQAEHIDALSPPGSLAWTEASSDAAGFADFHYTLSPTAGQNRVRFTATDGAELVVAVNGVGAVEVDVETSTLSAWPETAIADGDDEVEVQVEARDQNGNPLPGVQVVLQASLGDLEVSAEATDANGQVNARLNSTAAGAAQITASLDGTDLPPVEVSFLPVPEDGLYDLPWPNPVGVGEVLHVPFAVASRSGVRLELLDATDRPAALLIDAAFERGYHELAWTVSDLPPGTYVLRLHLDGVALDDRGVVVRGASAACDVGPGGALSWALLLAVPLLLWRRGRYAAPLALLLTPSPSAAGTMPQHGVALDARSEALGGALAVAHEAGLGAAHNPAALESVAAPLGSLGLATRNHGQTHLELLAGAPLGPKLAVAVTARHTWGLWVVGADPMGMPLVGARGRAQGGGLLLAYTPSPVVSLGAGVRGGQLRAFGEVLATAPLLDAGLVFRPPVPGLQIGLSGTGLGGAPSLLGGAAFQLDDELLPGGLPLLVTAQGGSIRGLPAAGAGVEVQPLALLALRAGARIEGPLRFLSGGLGLQAGPARFDYAASLSEGLAHTFTVTATAPERRPRAMAALREARDEARELERQRLFAQAYEEARQTTTADFVRTQFERTRAGLSAAGWDEAPEGAAEAEALLVRAATALDEGRYDEAWVKAVEADLALQQALAEERQALLDRDARREAQLRQERARAAARRAAAETATAEPPQPAAELAPEGAAPTPEQTDQAAALVRQGLQAYRQGDFATAAATWRQARELDPTIPGIDAYVSNAESKQRTVERLRGG